MDNDLNQRVFEQNPLVKQAVREALDDRRHKRYVTLRNYVRALRSVGGYGKVAPKERR